MIILLFVSILSISVHCVQFNFQNNEAGTIWVGIQGNPNKAHLSNGGFVLQRGQRRTINAPDDWAGRFWPRTWCDDRTKRCQTGDCGKGVECNGNGGTPPVTLVEITLRGWGGQDYYDVSLVDGFNIKASIKPDGVQSGGQYKCTNCACTANILQTCPQELKQINQQGAVIACNSACNRFNTDQYCCRGAHDKPETCRSSDWPKDYPAYFKKQCPDAYSYAYDDHKSTFTCVANSYTITFG